MLLKSYRKALSVQGVFMNVLDPSYRNLLGEFLWSFVGLLFFVPASPLLLALELSSPYI